jgi:hypothetical protein
MKHGNLAFPVVFSLSMAIGGFFVGCSDNNGSSAPTSQAM